MNEVANALPPMVLVFQYGGIVLGCVYSGLATFWAVKKHLECRGLKASAARRRRRRQRQPRL